MNLDQEQLTTKSVNTIDVRAVIMAGGSGTRLWPLSRQQLPKQFLSLEGGKTLFGATVDRLHPYVSAENVLVVTNARHANGEAYQALNSYEKLLEPVGRNTAPAIALAAASLQRESDGDPIMIVLPSDHIIKNVPAFHEALEKAIQVAQSGSLVTFGIKPTHADTGFGYIKTTSGEAQFQNGACIAEHFAEKPNQELAQKYLEDGNYYWNSGMFVWRASTILKMIREYLPDVASVVDRITAAWDQNQDKQQALEQFFHEMPDISIDYGVLEKIAGAQSKLALIPCDIGWSDVGSWDAVHSIMPKDENNNATLGNVLQIDCNNMLIHGGKRLITAVGVEDLCIIESADAILIAKRGESQRVREVVAELKGRNAQEHLLHLTVQRPWGSYTVLEEQPGYKMKRITVNPGAKLSLQLHQHRSEHWTVVSGTATVMCDDMTRTVTKNQSSYIPVGSKHMLENRGKIPLQLIEVQVGEYLEEDDIERFEDDYGRIS